MTTKIKNIVVACAVAVLFFGLSFACLVKPADATSDSERRELEQFPELSVSTLLNGEFMSKFEDYTLDQFPLRDRFRTLKSIFSFYVMGQKDNNNIYIEDGFAAQIEYPMNEDSLNYAAKKFEEIYNRYIRGKNAKAYFTVVPDKSYFLAAENGYLSMDYDDFMEKMASKTDFMEFIDIRSLLAIEDYYKTDTHWRQEKILDVAREIAAKMGVTLTAEYEEKLLDNPFYGVYYGQSALPLPAEEMRYLTNDILENCIVFDHTSGKEMSVYDMEKAFGKDPYEMFLGGSLSLITIDNPNATTDKELIIFRDSFGSSIAPLLVEGYAKVTIVDVRYILSNILGNLTDVRTGKKVLDFKNADVLFLYSTLVLNNSSTIK